MDVADMVKARPILSTVAMAAVVVAIALLTDFSGRPRADRTWVEHLSVLPTVDLRDSEFSVVMATDWSYTPEGPAAKDYTAFGGRFADLRNVWFVVEPHPGMRPMAHTLVLFEFADDRMIGLTIEARREAHEAYSALWGAFNAFELAYIWSTPRDLLTRRAVMLDHEVLVYPLALTAEQKERFLRDLLAKSQGLAQAPRFYNTLFSNCTNELAKTAGLAWNYAFILTGYSAEELHKMKLIPGDSMEAARANARMTQESKAWAALDAEAFNGALLAELRRRLGDGPEIAGRPH